MNDLPLIEPYERDDASITERVDALEREVAELRELLSKHSPKENAKRIELIGKIIAGLSQSIRLISLKIQTLIKRRQTP